MLDLPQLNNAALFERFERDLIIPRFFLPCRQKILIVVDGGISFGTGGFALSKVLNILTNNPEWWAKFDITCAHRQSDPAGITQDPAQNKPILANFKFNAAANINQYHQVWLFGIFGETTNDNIRLSSSELEILSRWMDEQRGGVLAMGDHDDLGAALCSRVPRVRSMRRWTAAQGVPPVGGLNRHDTLVTGANNLFESSDELDRYPMRITPKMYPLASWPWWIRRSAPHPLLCGTDRIIDILPDHPHEGDCINPASFAQTFSFGAYTNKPEYPTVGGVQPRPDVIAQAHVLPQHSMPGYSGPGHKGAANAKDFGAIGAYDGHGANVGRVVVDSTWHHWFNMNLPNVMETQDPVSFARIANYFRNVAIWLGPPARQSCMFQRATWGSLFVYPLIEEVNLRMSLIQLGERARDVIGRRAGQCTVTRWIDIFLPLNVREIFDWRPDPCLSCPPRELMEMFVLGGIVQQLLPLAEQAQLSGKEDERRIAQAMAAGVQNGFNGLLEVQKKSADEGKDLLKRLSSALQCQPPAEWLEGAAKEQPAKAAKKLKKSTKK